jgi:hypothetical protein
LTYDLQAGIAMKRVSPTTEVFIHRITQDASQGYYKPIAGDEARGIHFFDNYYDLSKQFKTLGIFSDADVHAVKASMCGMVNQKNDDPYKEKRKRNLYTDCD